MLARCPHCGVAHTLTRGEELRLDQAHCDACGTDFALFPALEIGGAGERTTGPGISSVHHAAPLDIERSPRQQTLELDIDTRPSRSTEPPAHRSGRGAAMASLALLLLTAFTLQFLLVPPVAPGTWSVLDQTRESLCTTPRVEGLCPRWQAPREPRLIRVSSPDLGLANAGDLSIRFELTSPLEQAWPVMDVQISDRLGTRRGGWRLHPEDGHANLQSPMSADQRYAIEIELPDTGPHITGAQITLH
ncbi:MULTISPECIES: hypothetical protein [unclassified Thioalkalivibrio]|uniref:hypothetical protein n=1 Tax=unclassified Thioalkalivibrio TaxID=2621013 RepID=UPI00037AB86D|nr:MULTISPECIES: hypothetical protein [unclassified Thioalkalivibrio]